VETGCQGGQGSPRAVAPSEEEEEEEEVHAPTEDKIDDVKDSFYEELERIFD
jgi:hypothetical protein